MMGEMLLVGIIHTSNKFKYNVYKNTDGNYYLLMEDFVPCKSMHDAMTKLTTYGCSVINHEYDDSGLIISSYG